MFLGKILSKISELFDLHYGHSLELNRLFQSSGPNSVNFVGRAARNNGVTAKVAPIANLAPAASGSISVALNGQGGAGIAFLQPFPYYCGFHVMVLTPRFAMPDTEKLWWALCITANRFRFGFGRQANRTLKNLHLPDRSQMPNWVEKADVDRFVGADLPGSTEYVQALNSSSWIAFKLSDLFEIRKGKRLTKASMKSGVIPFIGAIDKNNGVSASVSTALHLSNTITVNYNGSVAEAFYQPVPFWCSDDVNVLYPQFALTPAIALFICTIIRLERYRFSYGRKWHLERMRATKIRLPSTVESRPDWAYMSAYIQQLPFSGKTISS